jgi:hypothetical protein
MQFVFEEVLAARPLRLIEGPLSRFDGLSMLVGYGDKKALTRRRLINVLRRALQFARKSTLRSCARSRPRPYQTPT